MVITNKYFNHGQATSSRHALGDFAVAGVEPQYAPDLGLEPTHLDLKLEVDVDGESISGVARWQIRSRRANAQNMTFNAVDLEIQSVDMNSGGPIQWRYDGEHLTVNLKTPVALHEIVEVTIVWEANKPIAGAYFGGPADNSAKPNTWMATDNETERARYWMPCIDHPNIRTSIDTHLTAKASFVRLAPGYLMSEQEHDDGTTTSHWRLEQRCPSYLLCIVVGEFTRVDAGEHNGIPIALFAPKPYTAEQLKRTFGKSSSMMAWLTERLGRPFPYPKYFQFVVPGIGGAMENISLTSWDDAWMCDERYHAEMGWLVDLVNLHEMAHSYFGDDVVCRDYAHAWLKEGWATYMESVWLESVEGVDAMHGQMFAEKVAYRSEADNRYLRPIVTREFNSSWMMYDQHLYPGAAWRIHMLRHLLGEESFWSGVTQYLSDFSGKVVETSDFRHALEQSSGRSLAKFFDQWIYGAGYPKLKVTSAHDATQGQLTLSIQQMQQTAGGADGTPRVGLFECPLEVAYCTANGDWHFETVEITEAFEVFRISIGDEPTQVIIDPNMKLLHSLDYTPGLAQLRTVLLECPFVNGRLHAAMQLAKLGTRRALAALDQGYRAESHWRVRQEIARQLGTVGHHGAADILANLLGHEADPKVMQSLLESAGQFRHENIARALKDWLDHPERPYRAMGAALQSLGKQRGKEHIPFLKDYLDHESWWGWVRQSAQVALGQTREREAFDILYKHGQRAEQLPQVRRQLPKALVEAVQWLDRSARDRAREFIEDMIDTEQTSSVRFGAAALAQLNTTDVLPRLQSFLPCVAQQYRPGLQKVINTVLSKSNRMSSGALEKQVESLRTELHDVRKLLLDTVSRLDASDPTHHEHAAAPPSDGTKDSG